MQKEDISLRLTGRYVSVFTKLNGVEELLERKGIVTFIVPRSYLTLRDDNGIAGHIMFCGIWGGIYKINDRDGRSLYKNDEVIEVYKTGLIKEEEERDALSQKGRFSRG